MPSSTHSLLLFSSAIIRRPALSPFPRAQHKHTLDLPLAHATGEHQPLEGIQDARSYHTPDKVLQTRFGDSGHHRKHDAT